MAIKWGFIVSIFIFLLIIYPSSILADVERVILTPDLLQERIKSPQLQDGILTLDLTYLEIDLTAENNEFREEFYHQLHNYLNSRDQVSGLDLSHSLIKGDLLSNSLGISTVLSLEALPQNLTISEQKIIESNDKFSTEPLENMGSVILFRGSLQFNESIFTGKVDFKNTIFLQKIESKNSNFIKEINFSDSYFGRRVDFSGSLFEDNANFNRSQFLETVKFNQVQFLGDSNFNYTQFKQETDFSKSTFKK